MSEPRIISYVVKVEDGGRLIHEQEFRPVDHPNAREKAIVHGRRMVELWPGFQVSVTVRVEADSVDRAVETVEDLHIPGRLSGIEVIE